MTKLVILLGSDRETKKEFTKTIREGEEYILYYYEESHLRFFDKLPLRFPTYLVFPEAGLCPQEQLEFGSFLVNQPKFDEPHILETHSEDILTRIRTEILMNKTPAEDYLIYFFDKGERKEVRIEPNGKYSPGIPMTFFGAGMLECLEKW